MFNLSTTIEISFRGRSKPLIMRVGDSGIMSKAQTKKLDGYVWSYGEPTDVYDGFSRVHLIKVNDLYQLRS